MGNGPGPARLSTGRHADCGRQGRRAAVAVLAVLFAATVWRSVHLTRPLVDKMCGKQAMAVLWARSIARAPFDPFRRQLDLWDARSGRPLEMVEEFPLYFTMLAGMFRIFGEHAWLGRLISIAIVLAGSLAWFGLLRRRVGSAPGLVALGLLSFAPLVTFYARAVMPDAAMLGSMLIAVWALDRYLAATPLATRGPRFAPPLPKGGLGGLMSGRWGAHARKPLAARALAWLLLAIAATLSAGAFKYYGLIVCVPLAATVIERRGLLGLLSPAPVVVLVLGLGPTIFWTTQVFLPQHNPMNVGNEYFVWEQPQLLASGELIGGFFERALWKGAGAVAVVLASAGLIVTAVGALRRPSAARRPAVERGSSSPPCKGGAGGGGDRPRGAAAVDSGGRRLGGSLRWQLTGWTLAGVGFFLLLAPKALTHDYYALMLVPAASLWGAAGWRQLSTRHSSVTSHDSPLTARSWALPVVLIAAALAGSPWIGARRLFAEEEGLNRFAAMLAVHTEPDACICVVETQGGGATLTSLAEAGRIGWVRDAAPSGPEAWLEPGRIAAAGADYVAFYVNRAHYEGPALPDWAEQLTIVARQHGPWAKDGRTCTIVLARLDPLPTPPDEWRPDGRSRLPSGTFAPRP